MTETKMSKIVIHGAALKGRHVYQNETAVGCAYECHPERDNLYDNNAVSVSWPRSHGIFHLSAILILQLSPSNKHFLVSVQRRENSKITSA